MTIVNGSTILAADLNAMALSSLALLQDDNARLPGAIPLTVEFHGLVASTDSYRRRARIVIPTDMLLESIIVQTSPANSAAATITVDLTGDGALPAFACRVTGTLGTAGVTKQGRLLFDNSMVANPGVTPELTSRVARLLPRGSTILLTVETTNTLNTMVAQVTLAGRSRLAREIA